MQRNTHSSYEAGRNWESELKNIIERTNDNLAAVSKTMGLGSAPPGDVAARAGSWSDEASSVSRGTSSRSASWRSFLPYVPPPPPGVRVAASGQTGADATIAVRLAARRVYNLFYYRAAQSGV